MNKLVKDQVVDYKLMAGATDTDASLPEDERHADYYYQVLVSPDTSLFPLHSLSLSLSYTHTHTPSLHL
jgi:hypothetical protein